MEEYFSPIILITVLPWTEPILTTLCGVFWGKQIDIAHVFLISHALLLYRRRFNFGFIPFSVPFP